MTTSPSVGKQIAYISRTLSRYLDVKLDHLGLGSGTIHVLTCLYENDGVHQDILAEAIQFDKSSAARAVGRLEKEGYVTKKPDLTNRRRNIVRITEKALKVKGEILIILKGITEYLFIGFSEEEMTQYYELSLKINRNATLMLKEIK